MPFIGDLGPAAAIAPTDQIPIDQANLDGTTDTRRAPRRCSPSGSSGK